MAIQDVKSAYSSTDWNIREDYYKNACGGITIPPQPTTKDIMRLTAEIDAILSEALLELAYIKRNYSNYKTKMTLAEKEAFLLCKQTGLATNQKITEKEVTGMVVKYLKDHPLDGAKHSIYTLVHNVEYRLTFMESVVKILTEKKAGLISDNTMLKIEASLSDVGQTSNAQQSALNNVQPQVI